MSFLKALAGFVIGAICGAGLTLAICLAAAEIFSISQMEGAYAMGVVFFYMPLGAHHRRDHRRDLDGRPSQARIVRSWLAATIMA